MSKRSVDKRLAPTVARVLPALELTSGAARVALDAWLEQPLYGVTPNRLREVTTLRVLGEESIVTSPWGGPSYVNANLLYAPNAPDPAAKVRWFDSFDRPGEINEAEIRSILQLLDHSARGGYRYEFFDATRYKSFVKSDDIYARKPMVGMFLDCLYEGLRDGLFEGGMLTAFGVYYQQGNAAVAGKGLRYETGPKKGLIYEDARLGNKDGVMVTPRLHAALRELHAAIVDAWKVVADIRACKERLSPMQEAFIAWMREAPPSRVVTNKEVRAWWCAYNARQVPTKWGANDPAGPLLRAFCEKEGLPGSRAPWKLRETLVAA